jgi:predicted nucleotidyltransferase
MKNQVPDLFDKFLKIIDTINRYGVEYIVIDGVAMISHGMPRLTQDLDLLVKLTPENIGRLKDALHSIYDDIAIDEITYDEMNRYSVIRYGTSDGFYLDIMARIGDVADYSSVEKEIKEVEGVKIYLSTVASLLKLKENTIRPEDKRDTIFLKKLLENQKRQKNGGF